jgi:hypothetical protein
MLAAMRPTTLVSVTADRQLELPPEIQATLHPGDEYLIWQTTDTIVFKKVQKPETLADIRAKVNALGSDPEAPTLEELSQIVREVRQQA